MLVMPEDKRWHFPTEHIEAESQITESQIIHTKLALVPKWQNFSPHQSILRCRFLGNSLFNSFHDANKLRRLPGMESSLHSARRQHPNRSISPFQSAPRVENTPDSGRMVVFEPDLDSNRRGKYCSTFTGRANSEYLLVSGTPLSPTGSSRTKIGKPKVRFLKLSRSIKSIAPCDWQWQHYSLTENPRDRKRDDAPKTRDCWRHRVPIYLSTIK